MKLNVTLFVHYIGQTMAILDAQGFVQHLQVQLEPTTSWGILRRDVYGPSKYTGLLQATKDILREEGLPVSALT
jgi:hypothetical protein